MQLTSIPWAAFFLLSLLTPAAICRNQAGELGFVVHLAGEVVKHPLKNSLPSTVKMATNCAKPQLSLSLTPSPDANLTTPQLIKKYGYPMEEHTATSSDGYIITLFRIPRGRKNTKAAWNFPKNVPKVPKGKRPVALLWHGLMLTSSDWLMNPEDKCLPYILANAGYDVWLANSRGTKYSNKHVNMTTDNLNYWKFSWHEKGVYDAPAVIDYILAQTKEPKLYWIGYSMGTTISFVTLSMRPDYNAKVRSLYALSPVAFVGNMVSPIALLAPQAQNETKFLRRFGAGRFIPEKGTKALHKIDPATCALSPLALAVCGSFFFTMSGIDPCQYNTTEQISNIMGHTPDGFSTRTLIHYMQLKRSGNFRQYDHGPAENKKLYGSSVPPDYPLAKITAKVALFWGQNDMMAVPKDVARLAPHLRHLIANKRVNFELWSHLDFAYGMDVNPLVYDHVVKLMAKNYD